MTTYLPSQTRFRQDLVVTQTENRKNQTISYLIRDPVTLKTFEFGPEEYFLCTAMDGSASSEAIRTDFEKQFGMELGTEDLLAFSTQMTECGLMEAIRPREAPVPREVPSIPIPEPSPRATEPATEAIPDDADPEDVDFRSDYHFAFFDPSRILVGVLGVLRPVLPVLKFVGVWLLIPTLPIALFTAINNSSFIIQEEEAMPFLVWLAFHLLLMNFLSVVTKGLVATFYTLRMREFGVRFRYGFVPHLYITQKDFRLLSREQFLWTLGSSMLLKLDLFVWGVLLWFWVRGSGTSLDTWSISIAMAALIGFVIDAFPLRPTSDGYRWMNSYFYLPPRWLQQLLLRGYALLGALFSRRPRTEPITWREIGLLALVVGVSGFLVFVFFRLVSKFSVGLATSFPNLLGGGTWFILMAVFLTLGLIYWSKRIQSMRSKMNKRNRMTTAEVLPFPEEPLTGAEKNKRMFTQLGQIALALAVIGCLFLPYPYRPGGPLKLLPPKLQPIQAPITGKVITVPYKGGDGKLIKAGSVVAVMRATDIENTTLTTTEQVSEQQSVLDRLLNSPRPEEVAVARKSVEEAGKQVEVTEKSLDAAIATAALSTMTAQRLEELYKEGVYSQQLYEEAKGKAEVDGINVNANRRALEGAVKNLEGKQATLNLVAAGPHPDEIKVARAELRRLQQQLKYSRSQQDLTKLVMPISGYLETPYLEQKIGSFLNQGDTFASAQDDRNITGEAQVPEYDAIELKPGARVEIKLLAYAGDPIIAKVISVETNATTTDDAEIATEKVVRVVVEVPNSKKFLKPGMTGYVKVDAGTKPLILAFAHPIIRFVQVEMWSWMP
ncbi:HlyD family efflux transporter periplasmic adaptor subunit [Candidatus Cyanaurora vandensis]|uniref:HlyD family efflux transporter periplasmic adaptor subunit n=1 Tax=Candidatus Cyanaurora vandensis TaxID=2714958 RepID=UPI00257D6516|nr:HlyD family efflux transporter periplasmic adaptor subunit [Candidatus Cyanaurora vandensis]